MIRIGILGAGNIARTMAKTLRGMQARDGSVTPYAVASRTLDKASAFAQEEGFSKAFGSYEELVEDPKVDLIYIATPHSHHAEQIRLCVEHGKAVLCEKAFTANARQAEEVLRLAKEKRVLVTEAIWTRYMPSRRMIDELIASGAIGEPRVLTANIGYDIARKERIYNPALAGGALLDVGIYPLNFASMVFGTDVVRIQSSAFMMDTGVDHTDSVSFEYRDGKIAQWTATALCRTNRHGVVYGTKGCVVVDNINNPAVIELYDNPQSAQPVRTLRAPEQINGYEYEVEACVRALSEGRLECPEMPHEETLRVMRVMDGLREQWGVKYPFEA